MRKNFYTKGLRLVKILYFLMILSFVSMCLSFILGLLYVLRMYTSFSFTSKGVYHRTLDNQNQKKLLQRFLPFLTETNNYDVTGITYDLITSLSYTTKLSF